jgi:PleD family two-component response regulator
MNPSPADHPTRILIADDQRQNRQLLEIMLSQEGFVFVTAARGDEALAIVAKQSPDLILLDVMMPGMDGYQVAAKIKSNLATQHIPIIMVSSLHDSKARMLATSAGADDFISRPVERTELLERVKNLLRV